MRFGLRRLTTATVVALAPLAASACYFTTDFTGLSGGEADLVEGGGSEASNAFVDAVARADADGVPTGVDAGYPCLPGDFCDGFERAMVQGPWDSVHAGAETHLAITSHAHTGASALRIMLGGGAGTSGYVSRDLQSPKTVVIESSVFWSAKPDRTINFTTLTFAYDAESRNEQLFILFGGDGNVVFAEQEFQSGAQSFFHVSDGLPIVLGRWVTLGFEVDVSKTPATILAVYDGKVLLDGVLARQYAPAPTTIHVGSPYTQAGSPTTIDLDDAVIRVTQ